MLDDAQRRREKKSEFERVKVDRQTEENRKKAAQSRKSQQMVFNKFEQDFSNALIHHGLREGEAVPIEYIQFENLCRDLGFYDDKQITRSLIQEVWA